MTDWTFDSRGPLETARLGQALGKVARPGLVVALEGTLGAGKTAFVRGVAEGLETPDPRAVSSPTFVLILEYPGRLPIYHFDAYRLRSPGEFADLGADEYFFGDGVCLVEWADRVAAWLPADRLNVTITVLGDTDRRFTATPLGSNAAVITREWFAMLTLDEPSRR